ncbi:MAG: hypothetical protein QXU43_02270 [Thermoproteota archaeon]
MDVIVIMAGGSRLSAEFLVDSISPNVFITTSSFESNIGNNVNATPKVTATNVNTTTFVTKAFIPHHPINF